MIRKIIAASNWLSHINPIKLRVSSVYTHSLKYKLVLFTFWFSSYLVSPATVPLDTSLNTFIRDYADLKGTKFMCLEGGCGACVVTLKGIHPVTKLNSSWSVNSCLQNVYSCHGLDVVTIEGLGNKKNGLHKLQKRLADLNGTQCGFCTPGMIMNMYSLMESKDGKVTMREVEDSFCGNICRCTGYRPILDAFKSFAVDADESLKSLCYDIEDFKGLKSCPQTGTACAGKCSASEKVNCNQALSFVFEDEREWHKVFDLKQLFEVMSTIKYRPYQLVDGNTGHGIYRRSKDLKVFVDISSVPELKTFKIEGNSLEIGGGVSLNEAIEIFRKTAETNKGFEYLTEVAKHFELIGNVSVRNSGTVGGNLFLKYTNLQFPSDLYLIMEATGSKIVLCKFLIKFRIFQAF
jgi:xanthine dehydrogenase/oxidase